MSFAKFLIKTPEKKSEGKFKFATLLRSKDATEAPEVEQKSIKPTFSSLLSSPATQPTTIFKDLSYADKHPKYPAGSENGKGGQFMPKGSSAYKAAISEAKDHAKQLAEHIKNTGKDNDYHAKYLGKEAAKHIASAHEKGVNPEDMAQELTDSGLNQWQKKKHGLPLTAKEKEFTDKAMAAAMKLYNKKMAAKKLEDSKKLQEQADLAKHTFGESSKEYKVLQSKANKASAKAMEYGAEPAAAAEIPVQVAHDNTAAKEAAKKALYEAALITAKHSHLGALDDEHEGKHVEAFKEANKHYTPEEVAAIQNEAIAANAAKVAKGIHNLATAKSYHAKYQHYKNATKNSPEYQQYKQASDDYKHHYNAGADEHGLTQEDKSHAVSQGFAMHNAGTYGVQVIAPHGAPVANTPPPPAPVTPEPVAAPAPAPSASLPQAAQTPAQQEHNALSELDTPSKIKNAIYQSAHDFAKVDAQTDPDLVAHSAHHAKALNHYVSVEEHALKNGIDQDTIKHLQDAGVHAHTVGEFKLPFKAKSKNKSKLPMAAQSASSQAEAQHHDKPEASVAPAAPTPAAPVGAHPDYSFDAHAEENADPVDPYGFKKVTDKGLMAKKLYDSYHAYGLAADAFDEHSQGGETPPDSIQKKLIETKKRRFAAFQTFNSQLPDTQKILNKAVEDAAAVKYDPPKAEAAPVTLATSMAAKPKGKKVKPVAVGPIPMGTKADPHGLDQLDTKQKLANGMYAVCMKLLEATKRNDEDAKKKWLEKGKAMHSYMSMKIGYKQSIKLQNKAKSDHAAGIFKLPFAAKTHNLDPAKNTPEPLDLAGTAHSTEQAPTQAPIPAAAAAAAAAAPKPNPYEWHNLKNHPSLADANDDNDTANAKKELHDASYALHKATNLDPYNSSGVANASTEFLSAMQKAKGLIGNQEAQAVADAGHKKFIKDYPEAGTVDPVNIPAAPAAETKPIAALSHMPMDKTEAEALNKTLGKNYYTLRKLHNGDNNHPDVKASYENWNKLKDHMKTQLGYGSDFFSTTSAATKQEAEQEYNSAQAAKLQQKQSAINGYTQVSNDFHALSLSKGAGHPSVTAAKAGLEAATKAAKAHLSDSEIQSIDSAARAGAAKELEKKKEAALKEIHDAAYAGHMAGAEGMNSPAHIKAVNNLNKIVDKHMAAGNVADPEVVTAVKAAGVKAQEDIKQIEEFKKMVGNPKATADNYDANAAKFSYLGNPELTKARVIGETLYNSIPSNAQAALHNYTGSGYKNMNKALAAEKANKDAELIEKHIDKPLGVDMKLRRNMPQKWFLKSFGLATDTSSKDSMGALTQAQLDSMVGKVYHEPSFSSTSYDENQSLMVSNTGQESGGLILRIRANGKLAKGIFIDSHSSHSSEREVILQKGAAYVVRSIKRVSSGYGKFQLEVDVDLIGHIKKAKAKAKAAE